MNRGDAGSPPAAATHSQGTSRRAVADSSPEKRIANARAELEQALARLRPFGSERKHVEARLPLFAEYSIKVLRARFDARRSKQPDERLNEILATQGIPDIVEEIMPGRGLAAARDTPQPKRVARVEYDLDGIAWTPDEGDPSTTRPLTCEEIPVEHLPHGLWEQLVSPPARFLLRLPWNNRRVRQHLEGALARELAAWVISLRSLERRPNLKAEIGAYQERYGLTLKEVADRLAVSLTTLKSMKSSVGRKRYSNETFDKVRNKLK